MVVKISVSMPKETLEKLDAAAREAKSSRSALISQAAKRYLEKIEEQKRTDIQRKAAEDIDQWRG